MAIGGPSRLGGLQLGSAQLTISKPGYGPEPGPMEPTPSRQVVLAPAAFGGTTKMVAPDPASLGMPGGVSGTAETVPLISPAMVASVMSRGPTSMPMPVAETLPVLPAPPPPLAALPQTPPVYPLAPDEANPNISGTRGLLIGFVAGALLMGVFAAVYLLFLR
jgi:hypothetical protein